MQRRLGYRGTGTLRLNLPDPVDVRLVIEAKGVGRDERLYLASNLNGWNPRNDRFALRRIGEDKFELRQFLAPGTLFEFKVTRGGWNRVEVAADGTDLPNHEYRIHESQTIEIAVPDWQDHHPRAPKPHTTVGDVRSLGEFTIPGLNRTREVLIYLPPGYEHDTHLTYPVMYMWDGQNLFDQSTAFAGEWQVDEILEREIPRGKLPPMIVVAIYNGGEYRLREQAPWPYVHHDEPAEGAEFVAWVAHDLKKRIDRGFRTKPAPEHTGVGGSSMGGLTSLYAGFRYPEVFGRVMAMSPAIWFGERQIFNFIRKQGKVAGSKVYLDCGHYEGARRSQHAFLRQSQQMAYLLREIGYTEGTDLLWVEDRRGQHSEADWARRLPDAFKFLFGT